MCPILQTGITNVPISVAATLKDARYPEVPSFPPVTRRKQFGMKDENLEAKAEKKKDRKRKRGEGEKGKADKVDQKRRSKAAAKRRANRKTGQKKGKALSRSPSKQRLGVLRSGKKAKSPSKTPTEPEASVERTERPSSSEGPPRYSKTKPSKSSKSKAAAPVEPPAESPELKVKKNTKKVKKNTKKTAESKKTPPKGRKNKASQPQQDEYFDHYVECVNKVMDECESTDCVHPGAFEGKVPADFQISCYWTRHAVGAKVSKDRLETASTSKKNKNASKAKGKKTYKSKNYSQEA